MTHGEISSPKPLLVVPTIEPNGADEDDYLSFVAVEIDRQKLDWFARSADLLPALHNQHGIVAFNLRDHDAQVFDADPQMDDDGEAYFMNGAERTPADNPPELQRYVASGRAVFAHPDAARLYKKLTNCRAELQVTGKEIRFVTNATMVAGQVTSAPIPDSILLLARLHIAEPEQVDECFRLLCQESHYGAHAVLKNGLQLVGSPDSRRIEHLLSPETLAPLLQSGDSEIRTTAVLALGRARKTDTGDSRDAGNDRSSVTRSAPRAR